MGRRLWEWPSANHLRPSKKDIVIRQSFFFFFLFFLVWKSSAFHLCPFKNGVVNRQAFAVCLFPFSVFLSLSFYFVVICQPPPFLCLVIAEDSFCWKIGYILLGPGDLPQRACLHRSPSSLPVAPLHVWITFIFCTSVYNPCHT